MTPWKRGEAPEELLAVTVAGTARYVERRKADAGAAFRWPERGGVSVLQPIRQALAAQCDSHCTYCDSFPIDATGCVEVDHFKPKSQFPEAVLEWGNLYLVCTACNKAKLDEWNEALLRSDDSEYLFDRYFQFDTLTGKLLPRPDISEEFRHRAAETLRILDLNRAGLNVTRRRALKHAASGQPERPSEREFRFITCAPMTSAEPTVTQGA